MGTLVSNPTAQAAFSGQIFKKGLDLPRCKILVDDGTLVADPASTIRAGMIVTRNSTGYVAPATGLLTYGVAKWGKDSFGVSVQVDLPLVLNGTTATNLTVNGVGRGNVSNVTVRSAPNMAGTVYVSATDYTLNAGNGTVARIALGAITDGQTVYCTFTYALVDADFNFDGRFWQNQANDRTAYEEGRIAVITDWARIFTVEWTTGDGTANAAGSTYAINDALYCSAEGKFLNDSTGGPNFMGRVFQVPTASDPYMGIVMHGNPIL